MSVSRRTLHFAAMALTATTFSVAIVHLLIQRLPAGLMVGSAAFTALLWGRYADKTKWDAPDSP